MTTLTKETAVYSVDKIAVFPITADNSSVFTCGTGVDVIGARQISITPDIEEKTLRGDNKTLASKTDTQSVTINIEYAKLSLDLLKVLTGGSVTASGTGDTSKQTFSFGSNANANQPYFQIVAQIKGVEEAGDLQLFIYKAKATNIPMNGTMDDYATFTFDAKGVYSTYSFSTENKLYDFEINAKAATTLKAKVSA